MSKSRRLPYFDLLLHYLEKEDALVEQIMGRHVHWGYWPNGAPAKISPEEFACAAEALSQCVYGMANITEGMYVLDAGCGFGGTVESLNQQFTPLHLTGLNIDERQLHRAKKYTQAHYNNTVTWVQSNACTLPFSNSCFDALLAVECIFHFPSRKEFFQEAFRVLKPGGRLALSDFLPTTYLRPFMHLLSCCPGRSGFYGHADFRYDITAYRCLAEETGFQWVVHRDITSQILPTYSFLRSTAKQIPWSLSAVIETLLAEIANRSGILRYAVLAFEKPINK